MDHVHAVQVVIHQELQDKGDVGLMGLEYTPLHHPILREERFVYRYVHALKQIKHLCGLSGYNQNNRKNIIDIIKQTNTEHVPNTTLN